MNHPLVVFDLGRVLVRICDDWRHACRNVGIDVEARELNAAEQARAADIIRRYDSGEIDVEGFANEIAPLRGLRAEQVLAVNHAYLLGPDPGGGELIDELHTAGVQPACLSNTNANHWRMMNDPKDANHLPLDRLTHRFASHLIGCCKPDVKIYEHVERATGKRGEQILFFDDAAPNVDAARRRGWNAEVIRVDGDPLGQVRGHLSRHGVFK